MGFMDKIVGSINKGVDSVSANSKAFLEKSKLNSQIEELNRARNRYIYEIDNIVFSLYSTGELTVPQCDELCKNIINGDNKIADLKKQIEIIEQQRKEQQALNSMASIYSPAELQDGIKCSCGFTNKAGSKFCAACGSPLAVNTEETSEVNKAEE